MRSLRVHLIQCSGVITVPAQPLRPRHNYILTLLLSAICSPRIYNAFVKLVANTLATKLPNLDKEEIKVILRWMLREQIKSEHENYPKVKLKE